jgi:hypothetical protein
MRRWANIARAVILIALIAAVIAGLLGFNWLNFFLELRT